MKKCIHKIYRWMLWSHHTKSRSKSAACENWKINTWYMKRFLRLHLHTLTVVCILETFIRDARRENKGANRNKVHAAYQFNPLIQVTRSNYGVFQKTEAASPSITNVLSFSSLQRQHDARRFSWGTVRDAIRFKPTVQSNLTLKILNIK